MVLFCIFIVLFCMSMLLFKIFILFPTMSSSFSISRRLASIVCVMLSAVVLDTATSLRLPVIWVSECDTTKSTISPTFTETELAFTGVAFSLPGIFTYTVSSTILFTSAVVEYGATVFSFAFTITSANIFCVLISMLCPPIISFKFSYFTDFYSFSDIQ